MNNTRGIRIIYTTRNIRNIHNMRNIRIIEMIRNIGIIHIIQNISGGAGRSSIGCARRVLGDQSKCAVVDSQ